MKIGFLQFRPEFGKIEENVNKIEGMAENCDTDVLVLPELFSTGYVFTSREEAYSLAEEVPAGTTVQRLSAISRRKKMHIVAGIAEKSADRAFNSAVLVSPEGFKAVYRKIHLFSEEKLWFSPGDKPFDVYDIGICRMGIMICFDWFFPESMRILALKGADLVCHPANLVLPFCQDAMVSRCLENRIYAVTANRIGLEDRGEGKALQFTGKSQITGPDGAIIERFGESSEGIAVVDVDIRKARDKRINAYNDLFEDRRPEFYGKLIADLKINNKNNNK